MSIPVTSQVTDISKNIHIQSHSQSDYEIKTEKLFSGKKLFTYVYDTTRARKLILIFLKFVIEFLMV